jgi:signal transduction histidine kinase
MRSIMNASKTDGSKAMLKRFIKRHALWIGFAAVVLPLAVLLSLQYGWLVDLQRQSAVAETTYLRNYLEAVSSRVEYSYRWQAERSLNIPGSLFAVSTPKKVGYYFKKKKPEGAKALFAVNFVNKAWGGVLVFDPEKERFVEPKDAGMIQAIFMAIAPWKTLAHKGGELQSHGIRVEETDKGNRIILNPVTDDSSKVVGLVGMIVDNDHFRRVVLPTAIQKSVPQCDESASRQDLLLTVRNGDGRLVLGDPGDDESSSEVTGRLGFIFSDWELALGGNITAEEWAQSNFLLNVSLSALLALALVGGIVLALRIASREIKLSRMKSDFVSNVSHELRTPIASIRVFGEFLRLGRARTEDKSRKYGEYIETESRRLTQLINNILDFSKIESGAKTYEFEPSQIESIVGEAARTLEVSLKQKGFRLVYDPPDDPLPPVEIDPDAITQAVSNLVDNAVKYSAGPTEVRMRLGRENGNALISVEDHGIGIPRDEQAKIFDRFHRVSTGLVHNVKGSGLGLSIVNHIAVAHGGSVTVESEPGHGSTFTIHLPFCAELSDDTDEMAERI